jgi:hypothetical protein
VKGKAKLTERRAKGKREYGKSLTPNVDKSTNNGLTSCTIDNLDVDMYRNTNLILGQILADVLAHNPWLISTLVTSE